MMTRKQSAAGTQLAILWALEAPTPTAGPAPAKVTPLRPVVEPPPPTGPDPIMAFLERCELRNYSVHTTRSYGTDLRKARTFFRCCLLQATKIQVEDFLQSETRRGMNPTTVGRRLDTLRSFYKDAIDRELIAKDPSRGVLPPKKPKRLPKYLRDADVEAMMATLRSETRGDLREAAIVLTFYHTGMRLAELLRLNIEDVTGPDVRVFGKGSKERQIPINQALRAVLDAWIAAHPLGSGALFTSLGAHPSRLHAQQTRAIVKALLARAGLGGRGLTPHKLRHTFATRLINRGMRVDQIQQLLGHSGINTTMMYAHTELGDEVRAALDRCL